MQSLMVRYASGSNVRLGLYGLQNGKCRALHNSVRTLAENRIPNSFAHLDQKWRKKWQEAEAKKTQRDQWKLWEDRDNATNPKLYILPMFPYPSGSLHMGHFRVYTISDVISRFRRMQGYEVMHPIGWDAFGLPAENAARDRGLHPEQWTQHNIKEMWKQLELMNGQWDTKREFATCDPSFYKHTQRLFLLLHERGLAYQAEALVNYDPVDKTVLANEQVDSNGYSWRSGAVVEKKMLRQWFFKISEFRQELLDDLEHLAQDGAWPERVLTMQKNWLGKSLGARVKFEVEDSNERSIPDIEVFTTRPDTLFGVQYLALAATHPLVQKLAKTDDDLKDLIKDMHLVSPESKMGYRIPGISAYSPLEVDDSNPNFTKAKIPIYVAPYVLGDYGEGAVMGVPGHDARDYAFWKYNCPDQAVRTVIKPSKTTSQTVLAEPFLDKGFLASNNGSYAGLSSDEATKKLLHFLESENLGSTAESWRLRDWLVSRQRYWGTPIPIIHCDSCGPVPVPEDQLPVELPKGNIDWTKSNGNELFSDPEWLNTSCPKCGGHAKRETDTMDTFVDSSWYFMRFPDASNQKAPFSAASANENLPVDLYIGGVEHAILHLLYARFISKFLATTDLWPAGAAPNVLGEPFRRVLTQGMVHGKTYTNPANGRFLKPDEVDITQPAVPIVKATGEKAKITFEKMSKSKYNGVDPTVCVAHHGADITRAHMLFQAPVSDVLEWDEDKISGIRRWISRLFEFIYSNRATWLRVDIGRSQKPLDQFIWCAEMIDNPRQQIYAGRDNKVFSIQHKDDGFVNEKLPDGVRNVTANMKSHMKFYFEPEKKIWRTVQQTIMSVTNAYGNTHSLNTVVSDLMSLTNAIIDFHTTYISHLEQGQKGEVLQQLGIVSGASINIAFHSLETLIKLMAPITPAIAEELWTNMHAPQFTAVEKIKISQGQFIEELFAPRSSQGQWLPEFPSDCGSIFDQTFPEVDGSYELLRPATRTCAVQVNGKLKVAVEIPVLPEDLKGAELEERTTGEILKTQEAQERLMGGGGDVVKGKQMPDKPDIRKARKVIVVQGGKTVNYVI